MRKLYVFALLLIASISSNAQVISQIYGGGGNANATYTNDFIEIFNNTQTAIDLSGYSVQYAAQATTTGTFTVVAPLTGILQPGQYYLIQANSSGAVGGALPAPNATGTTNLAAGDGKVILVNSLTAVAIGSDGCPAPATGVTVLDFVGYGGANCAEGTAETGATNPNINTKSIVRASNGCTDSNDNQADFSVNTFGTTGAVVPRNTSTTLSVCPVGAPLPVKFSNIKAAKRGFTTELSFSNLTETDVVAYNVERSVDGIQFTSIALLKPMQNDGREANYNFTDEQPVKGVNFYRIKATEATGKIAYSVVVKMNAALTQSGLTISPNPVKRGQLNFQVTDLATGDYTLSIRNATGQVVYSQSLRKVENSFSQTISVQNLRSGMYYLELAGASKVSKQFIVE